MSHGNPFAVEDDNTIFNLMTLACVPEQYVSQILNIDDVGQKLYDDYVKYLGTSKERKKSHVHVW